MSYDYTEAEMMESTYDPLIARWYGADNHVIGVDVDGTVMRDW